MEPLTSNYFAHLIKGIHEKSGSRKLCFILGAGASRSSGIPTGSELAKRWYEELKTMLTPEAFESWKTNEKIDEEDLGTYYGIIYSNRFCRDKESGYEDLNKAMENAKPSFGYSVLAKILSTTDHNIVITTNFDSLTEASLYYYTGKHPLVCSHESLSGFAKPDRNRPLIAKIHRDLLMSPMSDPNDIDTLNEGWKESLDNILSTHIPIVIGYGGNDGSLMGYLENMTRKPSNLFWCVRDADKINNRVKNLVKKLGGQLVTSKGFDHLMFDLLFAMDDVKLIDGEIEAEAQRRSNEYKEQVKKIQEDKAKSLNKEDNINAKQLSKKAPKYSPYTYILKAEVEQDFEKREKIYLEGLEKFPDSGSLYSSFAYFLHFEKKDFKDLEAHYLNALKFEPNDETTISNYAIFLNDILKDYDKAEQYYLKGLELDPKNENNTGNYAIFLKDVRKDYDKAEQYYLKALDLNPNNAIHTSHYAIFLKYIRKNYSKAEQYYTRAVEIAPNNAATTYYYANFLNDIRKDYDKAEQYYLKTLELDSNDADYTGGYASFLSDSRKNYNKAEHYFLKALALDGLNANNASNYALFLRDVQKDYKKAEEYFLKAIDLDPNDSDYSANYAQFLLGLGKQKEAQKYIDLAFKNGNTPNLLAELWFYRYAHYPEFLLEAEKELSKLLDAGVRSEGWNFSLNIERAIKDKHPYPEKLKAYAKQISEPKEILSPT